MAAGGPGLTPFASPAVVIAFHCVGAANLLYDP